MGREVAVLYQGQPMLAFPDLAAWEEWLAAEHAASPGLWLKLAKKGCSDITVSYAEALDVALCFGWIDGQKRPLDDDYWLQRFTPRKPASRRSKSTAAGRGSSDRGRRTPAGRPARGRSGQGRRPLGRRHDGQSTAAVPDDLAGPWTRTRTPPPSSPRSTAGTGMRSCTGSRMPRSRRPGRPALPSSSRCCTITAPCTPFRAAAVRVPPGTDRCGRLPVAADLVASEDAPVPQLVNEARPFLCTLR